MVYHNTYKLLFLVIFSYSAVRRAKHSLFEPLAKSLVRKYGQTESELAAMRKQLKTATAKCVNSEHCCVEFLLLSLLLLTVAPPQV